MTLSVALALSALGVSPAVAQDDAFAFKPLLMPFPAGEGTILSGYKDPQNAWHRGPGNDYSLDFCQGRCEAGKDGVHKVVAPTDLVPVPVLPALDTTGDAVLDYHFFEVAESSDRKLCMALGHFDLTAKPDAQGVYPRGTELGTLVPYFGRPHVHIGMWTVAKGKLCNVSIVTGKERTAVAFEGQYELDGRSFPDSETDAVQDGLVVVSRNVIGGTPSDPAPGSTAIGPSGKPVSRPGAFEARLPWSAGEAHSVTARYDIESPAGFGLTFTGEVGDAVHPIYKGNVEYAGCATGRSAPLGRIVVLRREIDGHTYDAVYGHLDASYPLPGGPVLTDQVIGRFGSSVTTGTDCTGSDGGTPRLYLGILRDADISPSGEISGGRPVYAEPMVWS